MRFEFFVDDVLTKPGLADYAGELQAHMTIRITDRDLSGAAPNAGTTSDIPMPLHVSCVPVADPQEGSSCAHNTTMEAIIPGSVKEGKRTIWALGRVELYDGGSDGAAATTADNTLFATQGLFIP